MEIVRSTPEQKSLTREEIIAEVREVARQECDYLAVNIALAYDEMLQAGKKNARRVRRILWRDLPKRTTYRQKKEVICAMNMIDCMQRARRALPTRV